MNPTLTALSHACITEQLVHAQSLRPPIVFEQNTGRHPEEVAFVGRLGGDALFLAERRFVLVRGGEAVCAELVDAGAGAAVRGEDRRSGVVRHILGNDPSKWHEAPVFGAVRYVEPWPGVDVRFHTDRGELEYDFVVRPGADPDAIALRFPDAAPSVDADGDLVLATGGEPVRHRAPVAWQDDEGTKQPVAAAFVVDGDVVRLRVGAYDRTRPLTIDPVIVFTTWLGGNGSEHASRVDLMGTDPVVVGVTGSNNFPLSNPTMPNQGGDDVFVTRFTADGSSMVFSTYLGGSGIEGTPSVSINGGSAICVAGGTTSLDYPTLGGAFQTANPGGVAAFLTVLDDQGAMVYSTYYGGSFTTRARAVATNGSTLVVIGGETGASNLPGTQNGFQPVPAGGVDGFAASFIGAVPGGLQFAGATYYGGSNTDSIHALDAGPAGIVASGMTRSDDLPSATGFQSGPGGGRDGFVVTFGANMSAVGFATYLGGSGDENWAITDGSTDVAWGPKDLIHLTGDTMSLDFPVSPGAYQPTLNGMRNAYVTVLDPLQPGPGALVFSTYLGGSNADGGRAIDVDADGNTHVTGFYRSNDHPQLFAFGSATSSLSGAMIAAFDTSGALAFSTAYGVLARGSDIVCGPDGYVVVTGDGSSIPVTPGAFQPTSQGTDVWVAGLRIPFATIEPYGQGTSGTFGEPSFRINGRPVLGTVVPLSLSNPAGVPSLGVLALGTAPVAVPAFGGSILVIPSGPLVTLFLPVGETVVPIQVPADPTMCGVAFYLQAGVLDPGAIGNIALTRGLAMKLGL